MEFIPISGPPFPGPANPQPPQPKPQWIVVTVKDHLGTIYGAFTVAIPPGQPLPGFHATVQHLY